MDKRNWVFLFLVGVLFNCYSLDIPLSKKLEYGCKLNEAFVWQSNGHSITAAAIFEEAIQKAEKVGESAKKLSAIRRMFVWYRTYGHHLKLMDPPATDWDIIYGEYGGRPLPKFSGHRWINANYSKPEQDYRKREYLVAVTEVLSGILGVWIIPSPNAKRVSGMVAFDGFKRMWNIYQNAQLEQDISLYELQKISDAAKEACQE